LVPTAGMLSVIQQLPEVGCLAKRPDLGGLWKSSFQ
jgi:hypothetical protein